MSKWDNLFPPTDYEDCAAHAAKTAKSKEALSVLISVCESEFRARRKDGYDYYKSCPGRRFDIGGTFNIKGPKTPDEQRYMEGQCSAAIEAERLTAKEEAAATGASRGCAQNTASGCLPSCPGARRSRGGCQRIAA
jgi:hypothetical protein